MDGDVARLLESVDNAVLGTLNEFYPEKTRRKGKQDNVMNFPVEQKRDRDDKYTLWVLAGKPGRDHPISQALNRAKLKFRRAVRAAKREQLQTEAKRFLKNHKRLKKLKSPNVAETVGNANTKEAICEMWRQRFAGHSESDDMSRQRHRVRSRS